MSTSSQSLDLTPDDVDRLRRLAARIVEMAKSAENIERKRAWLSLDAGDGDRTMILAEADAIKDANFPLNNLPITCESPFGRQIERELRATIWKFEELRDDRVVSPCWNLNWQVTVSNYGIDAVVHRPDEGGPMGAYRWDPALRDFNRDFHLLKPRTYRVDRAATWASQERLNNLFGDILHVRIRGNFWWSMGLTMTAARLVGMENMMLMMYDNPDGLHRLMTFLRDDHLAYAEWLEREGLLSLNNENDYVGSGSCGYAAHLPALDARPSVATRLRDLWVLAESQETVGVSPELFDEFVFQYQLPIVQRFGACYYGCCEPLHTRLHVIRRIPNLRKVSVSAWADQALMAQALGREVVFSRKPNPTLISAGRFDEEHIRQDLRETLEVAAGCRLEIIMRTVHTLANEPRRLARWVELARNACLER